MGILKPKLPLLRLVWVKLNLSGWKYQQSRRIIISQDGGRTLK